jgi:hypothetical protein
LGRREGALPAGSAYVVQFMVVNALGPALVALLFRSFRSREDRRCRDRHRIGS